MSQESAENTDCQRLQSFYGRDGEKSVREGEIQKYEGSDS